MKHFPKWVFHNEKPAHIVNTQEELDALGDEWATHPDLLKTPAAEAEPAGDEN